MTVTYTGRVANANVFVFSRLLFHWKGSIYKLMYKEMFFFCILYALLSLTYRLALNEDQKRLVNHTHSVECQYSISDHICGRMYVFLHTITP